jgi:hypothetical protein
MTRYVVMIVVGAVLAVASLTPSAPVVGAKSAGVSIGGKAAR